LKIKQITYIGYVITLLLSCKNFSLTEKPEKVAIVGDQTLYKNQLSGIVPEGIKGADSLAIIKKWIDNWVLEQLLIQKAEENLKDELKDFEKQLNDYRKSLLIFTYENEIAKNLSDTSITNTQIRAYYDENRENFLLNDNIIRVNYIITGIKGSDAGKLKRLISSSKENDKNQLSEFCSNNAYKCFTEDSVWMKLSDLQKDIPLNLQNEEQYMTKGKLIELKDSSLLYILYIKDAKQRRETAPLEEVKENIKSILLNKRKLKFIEKMRQDLYKEALENKEFEVFVK
jgi:hypothetical protein